MPVIQEGDIVVISKAVNLSKYPYINDLWISLRASHVGRQGRVLGISRTSDGRSICSVELLETSPTLKVTQLSWYIDDVSLSLRSKWRRQTVIKGEE